jgi:hypothetical protein
VPASRQLRAVRRSCWLSVEKVGRTVLRIENGGPAVYRLRERRALDPVGPNERAAALPHPESGISQ